MKCSPLAAKQITDLSPYIVPLSGRLSVLILPRRLVDSSRAVLAEIGRARKQSFSEKGAGGNGALDLDSFDEIYNQMCVIERTCDGSYEIIGGYRFYLQTEHDLQSLDMDRLFDCSSFYKNSGNMPALELGRSFIVPRAQKQADVFSALFSGLGLILNLYSQAQWFFGKITFYPDNQHNGAVLQFLRKFHGDVHQEIHPRSELSLQESLDFSSLSYYQALRKVRSWMPEILRIYLRFTEPKYALVSPPAANEAFGDGIFEAAFRIFIPAIGDVWQKKFLQPTEKYTGQAEYFFKG